MVEEPNADTAPPGSSESFNDFKDRVIGTIANYAMNGEGHNTVIVTHSKAIGAFDGWEHAGYPEDGSIHMPTYAAAKDTRPGGHQEVELPTSLKQHDANFDQRFAGWPQGLPLAVPGESFNKPELVYGTLKGLTGKPVEWPTDPSARRSDADTMRTPYYPDVDPSRIENVMEDPNKKLIDMLGPRGEGGGGSIVRGERITSAALRHRETGKVSEGFNHADAYDKAEGREVPLHEMDIRPYEEGFMTSEGRFVDRYEAAKIANAAKQGIGPRESPTGIIREGREGAIAERLDYSKGAETAKPKGYWMKGGEGYDKIKDMVKEGKTSTEISKELGITPSNVARFYRRSGIENSSKTQGSKGAPPGYWTEGGDGHEIFMDLHKQGMRTKDIAEEIGLTPAFVSNLKKRLGL